MTLESTLSGTWYPAKEAEIAATVAKWETKMAELARPDGAPPNILILPHAGWTFSGECAWRAVRTIRSAAFKRVVILAPCHVARIANRLVAPEADSVSTPLGTLAVDREWLDRFSLMAPVIRHDRVHRAEHSAQIEYPLLQTALAGPFKVVPLIAGFLAPDQMAMCARALRELMDGETLLVVSSDFTHYGDDFDYTPFGMAGGEDVRAKVAALDDEAFTLIAQQRADDFKAFIAKSGATICGAVPIELALRAMPDGTRFHRTGYETSSDNSRDFVRFVCYTSATASAKWPGSAEQVLNAADRAFLLRTARQALEYAVKHRRALPKDYFISDAPSSTLAKMGAFVTLNDAATMALRGCIGEILPVRPLVEAVAARAVDSALHDPRFLPVTERELSNLRIEVSALTPPKPIASYREIVLGRDGMTLEKDGAFAVFLPQVAPEQGWSLEETLSYLSQKAGLSPDAWREGASFETFRAEVFHE